MKMTKKLYTWIDQDLCTGDGLCEEVCPDIFFAGDDGLFYVKDVKEKANPANPRLRMAQGLAYVPDNLVDSAIEAAEECPGECIFFTEIDE
jgi:ferredoxin